MPDGRRRKLVEQRPERYRVLPPLEYAGYRTALSYQVSSERALRELGRIRAVTLDAAGKTVRVVTRRSPLQSRVLAALGVATGDWDRARIR